MTPKPKSQRPFSVRTPSQRNMHPTPSFSDILFHTLLLLLLFILHTSSSLSNTTTTTTTTTTRHLSSSSSYNILSLGGSVTYGATLPFREGAYPYILARKTSSKITNLSIRATGADYSARCLRSMISSSSSEDYDVIVLEFSLNGYRALQMLLQRLRYLFPNAIIVYVHLYSLRNEIVNENGMPIPSSSSNGDSERRFQPEWEWGGPNQQLSQRLESNFQSLLSSVGNGYVFAFPKRSRPADVVEYFQRDWHHLSPKGHVLVADGIRAILDDAFQNRPPMQVRDDAMDLGDTCLNWFHDGDDLHGLKQNGGTMNEFQNEKFALEFRSRGSVAFSNAEEFPVPVYLSYLTRLRDYPVVKVRLGDAITMVQPSNHPNHVTERVFIGWANKGEFEIEMEVEEGFREPFRLVGVIVCGACIQYPNLLEG